MSQALPCFHDFAVFTAVLICQNLSVHAVADRLTNGFAGHRVLFSEEADEAQTHTGIFLCLESAACAEFQALFVGVFLGDLVQQTDFAALQLFNHIVVISQSEDQTLDGREYAVMVFIALEVGVDFKDTRVSLKAHNGIGAADNLRMRCITGFRIQHGLLDQIRGEDRLGDGFIFVGQVYAVTVVLHNDARSDLLDRERRAVEQAIFIEERHILILYRELKCVVVQNTHTGEIAQLAADILIIADQIVLVYRGAAAVIDLRGNDKQL